MYSYTQLPCTAFELNRLYAPKLSALKKRYAI